MPSFNTAAESCGRRPLYRPPTPSDLNTRENTSIRVSTFASSSPRSFRACFDSGSTGCGAFGTDDDCARIEFVDGTRGNDGRGGVGPSPRVDEVSTLEDGADAGAPPALLVLTPAPPSLLLPLLWPPPPTTVFFAVCICTFAIE